MITNYIPLISKRGFRTQIRHAFEQEFSSLACAGEVDAFIVATEDGFSPLGAARQFFASDLGISEQEIAERANWNRFDNDRVTLVAFASRRRGSFLRGVILAPCENSECYKRFAQPLYGQPSRDFYYNVTYEAIAHASRAWGARRLAISHLSASGNFHEDIATCNAEALAHFCDEATAPVLDSFTFVGCCGCIEPRHLEGIKRLNSEGEITQHRPITVEIEARDGVVLIHISWASEREQTMENRGNVETPISAWAEAMLDALKGPNANYFGFAINGQPSQHPCQVFLDVPKVEQTLLSRYGDPGLKLLDVGCGAGRHLKWIHEQYPAAALWATESDPALREHCRLLGYVETLPSLAEVTKQDFDLVLLLGGNIGLGGTEDGVRALLQHIFNKMAPGGVLLAEGATPFREPFTPASAIISYKGRSDAPFPWCFCTELWFRDEVLAPAGFEYIETRTSESFPGGYIVLARKPEPAAPPASSSQAFRTGESLGG